MNDPCRHHPLSRRQMLSRCAQGFGALAFSALAGPRVFAKGDPGPGNPAIRHFAPKADSIIFLYMDGGPSQVDSFDPKPRLDRENGQPIGMDIPPTQFDDVGTVLKSPWEFRNYGESGIPVSDLFPSVARHVDDLCVIRSMVAEFPEHTNANYFLHTGFGIQGRPSMGAWVTYGLGSEAEDLPGFVVLNGGLIPPGGLDNFHSGFLPPAHQGSVWRMGDQPVANTIPLETSPKLQRSKLDLVANLDRAMAKRTGDPGLIEAAIAQQELAFRMQATVPDLTNLKGETPLTRRLFGMDDPFAPTRAYGAQCLLARRLVERGVRFVELTCQNPAGTGDRWDQHDGLVKGHEWNAQAVDRPIAGLLTDLKARGLLDRTLVVWAGEFGRTPMAQGTDGRDHNPHGFSIWMAGGGVKGGHIHGATDEYGYFAVRDKVTVHDLHATMLHLLGMDHKSMTYRFSGRDMRLTDVHGEIVHDILA